MRSDRHPHPARLHWGVTTDARECWRSELADTLRQAVACADAETARAALDTALQSRLITRTDLVAAFATEPIEARMRAASARPGSDSAVESIAAQRFDVMGLDYIQQVEFAGIGRVDFLIASRLIVEIDGYPYHSSRAAFDRDHRRDALLVARGYVVLRFSAAQVLSDWRFVENMVRATLATMGR